MLSKLEKVRKNIRALTKIAPIIAIAFFAVTYFQKEKLGADFDNAILTIIIFVIAAYIISNICVAVLSMLINRTDK